MRLRTVVLSLLPGAAHVDLGRAKRGLLYFFLFAFFVNGALLSPFMVSGGQVRAVCLVAAGGIWLAALVGALRSRAAAAPPAGEEAESAHKGEATKTRRTTRPAETPAAGPTPEPQKGPP